MAKGYSTEESYTSDLMTRREVERVFHLSPEPPAMNTLNDYILASKRGKKSEYFLYFCTTTNKGSIAIFTIFCKETVPINMTQNVFLT